MFVLRSHFFEKIARNILQRQCLLELGVMGPGSFRIKKKFLPRKRRQLLLFNFSKVYGWSGHNVAASGRPRPLKAQRLGSLCYPVPHGQYAPRYVTYRVAPLHAAFVADAIWGVSIEPSCSPSKTAHLLAVKKQIAPLASKTAGTFSSPTLPLHSSIISHFYRQNTHPRKISTSPW